MSRYDYVKYEKEAQEKQLIFKDHVVELDRMIGTLDDVRSTEYAIKALQECYMWIGHALKNEQIKANSGVYRLQEERTNS